MRAIIFAAGVGVRLGDHAANLPKVLLRFAGQSLLERHIRILRAIGIDAPGANVIEQNIVAG